MEDKTTKESHDQNMDVDKIIEERDRLDKLFKDQFTRIITVMFTDLKGSTSLAETHGDFATRSLIKQHNDILFPLFKKYNGTLVKTMGDGTMSYFADPLDAVRAAVEMQKGMDAFNMRKKLPMPVLMRIGIHTGQGIVEKNDIFGDIVNVASRIEGQASPGEIYISQETYNALSDKSEIYCGFAREAELKGKKDAMKLYKAFWNPGEIDRDLSAKIMVPQKEAEEKFPLQSKIGLAAVIALFLAFMILKMCGMSRSSGEENRRKEHSVTIQDATE